QTLNVDAKALKSSLESEPQLEPGKTSARPPQTLSAKAAIQAAVRISQGSKHAWVCTGHMLIGLLEDPSTVSARELNRAGVTRDSCAAAVERAIVTMGMAEPTPSEPGSHTYWFPWMRKAPRRAKADWTGNTGGDLRAG